MSQKFDPQFWNDYQNRAITTAAAVPNMGGHVMPDLGYRVLGLIGELGEFASADPEDLPNLTSEIGDVLWYLSATLYHLGATFGDIYRRSEELQDVTVQDAIVAGMTLGNVVKKIYRDDEGVVTEDRYRKLIGLLSTVFHGLGGPNAMDAATGNLTKLFARLEKGTIHGDGDKR